MLLEVYVNGVLFDMLPFYYSSPYGEVVADYVQLLPGGYDYEFAIAGF